MQFDSSQQVSATYLRNNASEVIDEAIKEGIRVIVRRSNPIVVMLPVQEYEKLKNPTKPKKKKKFDLEEIQKNNTFYKYTGCAKNDPDFKGLTAVQVCKKWTDYVD
jgi:prevent-host-death family protein